MAKSRMVSLNEIQAFYDENAQYEWERLDRHRTEFAVTMRVFKDYLMPPPADILDVGGGPGRYSIALAQQGYRVTLLDLSRKCLELAEQKAKEAGVQLVECKYENATDLAGFRDGDFDAVLLMGPLYHLLSREGRVRAVGEASRVLKPQGTVFASFITRYAVIRSVAKADPKLLELAKQVFETGIYQHPYTPGSGPHEFTSSHYVHLSEIKPLMEEEGFETLDLIACEGAVSMIEEKINELTGELLDAWVELNYRLGKDPMVHGSAEHLLYVGRKRRGDQ